MKIAALAISLFIFSTLTIMAIDDVHVVPFSGPIGTTQINVPNGSAAGYRMAYQGQKGICFKNMQSTTIYLGTSTVNAATGYPLFTQGEALCLDLAGGTTVYFFGTDASQKAGVFFTR